MAGTVLFAEQRVGRLWKFKFTWITDETGSATYTLDRTLSGWVAAVVHKPGGDGAEPNDAYRVTIVDEDGVDVLNGSGFELPDIGVTQYLRSDGTGVVVSSTLKFTVENAGVEKGGVTILYLEVT